MTCDVICLSLVAVGLTCWLTWLTWEITAATRHDTTDQQYMIELERVLERIYRAEQRMQSLHLRIVELEKERTYWKN